MQSRLELARRLDRTLNRLRRLAAKPALAAIEIPSLGRCVYLAKLMACIAISEHSEMPDHGKHSDSHSPSVKEIAQILDLEHSTASRILSEAEAEGLVERDTDPEDRRRTIVGLTADGRSAVTDSVQMRSVVLAQVLSTWDAKEIRTLVELLEKFSDTVSERMPEVKAEAHALYSEKFPRA